MFRYSLSNWTCGREPIADTFERLHRLGFDGIELTGEPERYDVNELAALSRRYGLKIFSVLGQYPWPGNHDLANPDPEVRNQAVRYLVDCCEFASRIGAGIVVVLPSSVGKLAPVRYTGGSAEEYQLAFNEEWDCAVDAIGRAARRAEELGVILSVEPINRYETYLVRQVEQALKMVWDIGSRAVRIQLDTFHMNIEEPDMVAAVRAAGDLTVNIHMADSHREAAGTGHIDFRAILAELIRLGYDGLLTIEHVPAGSDAGVLMGMPNFPELRERFAATAIQHLKSIEQQLR